MKIWYTNSRKWGNKYTGINICMGLAMFCFRGFIINILYNSQEYIKLCKNISKSLRDSDNWIKYTFPVPEKYLI